MSIQKNSITLVRQDDDDFDDFPLEGLKHIEHQKRLDLIEEAMGKMWPSHKIVNVFKEQFECTPRAIQRYIHIVHKNWIADSPKDKNEAKLKIRNSLIHLYNRALQNNLYFVAVAVIDRLAKLDGVFDTNQGGLNGIIETPNRTTSEQRKEIESLLERRQRVMAQLTEHKSNGNK